MYFNLLCLISFKRMDSVFKQVQCGIAHCVCCSKKIYLFQTIEEEFWSHFSIKTHIEFLIQFFLENQNSKCQQFNKDGDIIKTLKKEMSANINIREKINQLFKLERDRLAYCKLCNTTVILKDSLINEYYEHFQEISHQNYLNSSFDQAIQFQKKYINQQKLEQEFSNDQNKKIIQQDFKMKKQMKNTEKSENNNIKKEDSFQQQFYNKRHQNIQVKQQNQNFCVDQIEKQKEKKLKIDIDNQANILPFNHLVEKYFLQFIQELTSKENELEAICFILAKTGKVARQICVTRFEEMTQELLILSKNGKLSEELVKIFLECKEKLEHKYGLVNAGYLFKQPCLPQDLEVQLEKAKQILHQQTSDKLYLQFLASVSITALTNQIKNLTSTPINQLNYEINLSLLRIADDLRNDELPNLDQLNLENSILQYKIEEEIFHNSKNQ